MKLPFTKMHGCGNDYIYIDGFLNPDCGDPAALSRDVSRYHFGVGADGVILILPSEIADARMRVFNADGSEAMMCGNGIRCVGKYLYDSGLCRREEIRVETLSGIKTLRLSVENGDVKLLAVDMGEPVFESREVPVNTNQPRLVNHPLFVASREHAITCVSMGNPHCVVFGSDPDALDLEKLGPAFAERGLFPEGVNTEFVQVISPKELKMRVYERGSGETLACGTGACAAVAAAVVSGHCERGAPVTVHLPGGDLQIAWRKDGGVTMAGPAVTVFTGVLEV